MKFRLNCLAAVAAAGLCAVANTAGAQNYPNRAVRIIIPYATGGSTDVVFRILAPRMSEGLGQQVVVDNRPGGASTIGMEMVARSAPDGYTIGVANIATGANPSLFTKMPYDTEKDFAPVSLVARVPMVLSVHPSVPARNVKELLALAKARPGTLTYASAGNASANHMATEMFKYMTGVDMVHVPYKSGGQVVVSLVGGETALAFATIPSAHAHIKAGRLRALGVSTAKRAGALPDVPTIAEAGVAGYDTFEWQGAMVPSGTPAPIIGRLHQEFVRVMGLAEVKERLLGVGADPVASTPEELAAHLKREMAMWGKVIKAAGIRMD